MNGRGGYWAGKPGSRVPPNDKHCHCPGEADPKSKGRQSRMSRGKHGQKVNRSIDGSVKKNGDQNTAFCMEVEPGEEKTKRSNQHQKIRERPKRVRYPWQKPQGPMPRRPDGSQNEGGN